MKSFFPLAFKATTPAAAIAAVVIYLAIGIAYSLLSTLITHILPLGLIRWLLGIVGSLLGLYLLGGVVLTVLVFLKVID